MNIKKILYIILGCVGVALGALGAALPLMPAFPFLLLAAYCFGKSSEKLHNWFTNTKLYKNNLESFVMGKGMTIKAKRKIMLIVTATMLFGFIMMSSVPIGRIVLMVVWAFHIIYFIWGIKTIPQDLANYKYCKNVEIQGMQCEKCAKRVQCAINKNSNIYAEVNYQKGIAKLKMPTVIQESELIEIVNATGYKAGKITDNILA